jgi:hypothetical protein
MEGSTAGKSKAEAGAQHKYVTKECWQLSTQMQPDGEVCGSHHEVQALQSPVMS